MMIYGLLQWSQSRIQLIKIYSPKTPQNLHLSVVMHSVPKLYSPHVFNVDVKYNLDIVIGEGVHEYEEASTKPYYVIGHADCFPARVS